MKILYLDCGMGAAGDMLAAALLELMPDREAFVKKLNSVSIPGVVFRAEDSFKCGIKGTHLSVLLDGISEDALMDEYGTCHHEHDHEHDHEHEHHDHEHAHAHHTHTGISDIRKILADLSVPEKVRRDISSVYDILAQAESHVHGESMENIHFHEVGTMDAIADITAVCLLMDELSADRVVVSPVHVGSGTVRCAHGILPVPAPATAHILKDIPIYGGTVEGELCTPTGAALLKYFADEFAAMPVMRTERTGYGMGHKDFERANCIRAFYGSAEEKSGCVLELSFNVDDMTAEDAGFACEMLYKAGAREVFTIPAGMKKFRQGILICVICDEDKRQEMIECIFKNTSTIGIRESRKKRYILERRTETVETPYGEIRRKISSGYGTEKIKYEYDDLRRIALENGLPLEELRKQLP